MKILKILQGGIYLALLVLMISCNGSSKTEEKMKKMNDTKAVDPHSYAEPNTAVVTHLNWVASVDFDNKVIEGVAHLSIETKENAEELVLDNKGLHITKVTLGEDEGLTEFEIGPSDPSLGSPIKIKIGEDTKLVNVHYKTDPSAEALQWLGPEQTSGGRSPFLFTQSQAILARSWVPIQDSPGIRFTYEATVTVPATLLALMSAENPQEKNEDGVYHFKMSKPIPAYLLALAVGDLTFEAIDERTGVYAEPDMIEKAAYEFAETGKMLEASEELYGPYQWERYDLLVLPPSFPFGGMENPRLTFATPTILAGDRSLTSLVAHEMAHSWSGNLVTNATWNDFWLNEGFTVYFENRIMEAIYGRSYAEMLANLSLQDLKKEIKDLNDKGQSADTKLKLELKGRDPDDGMTSIAYDKGCFFLLTLEEKVGRQTFDAFLRKYFEDNAFKSMDTESFIQYANEHLFRANNIPVDSSLYNQWIYGEGLPETMPEIRSDRFLKVDSAAKLWLSGTSAKALDTKDWSTHEWLHFIQQLPDSMSNQQMQELDNAFGFTQSGNAEILTVWFVHAIRNGYTPAYGPLENFLIEVGRRKFLMPLYGELVKTESGKTMAEKIYEKARPNYHFVSANSIDNLLGQD